MGRTATEPYLLVDADLHDDEAIIRLADQHGPLGPAAYVRLLCMAKEQRDCGRVLVKAAAFFRSVGDRSSTNEERQHLWMLMENLRLVSRVEGMPGEDDEFTVEVLGWSSKQTLTKAEKARLRRAREGVSETGHDVPISGTREPIKATAYPRQGDRERSTIGTDVPPPVVADEAPLLSVHDDDDADADDAPTPPQVAPKVDSAANVRRVFEFWLRLWSINANTVLDSKRERRIRWALKTYGLEGCEQSLRGWRRDPWDGRHTGMTGYNIATLFRDAAQVEKGIELFRGDAARPALHLVESDDQRRARRQREMEVHRG